MRNGLIGSMSALLAGAGLALAQPPASTGPAVVTLPAVAPPATVVTSDLPLEGAAPAPGGLLDLGPSACRGEPCCGPFNGACGVDGQYWINVEWIYWWVKDNDGAPPLVVAGPGVPAIGTPGTVVLFNGSNIADEERHGFRYHAGAWFTQYRDFGIEVGGFVLGSRNARFNGQALGGPGNPNLGIPILDTSICPPVETSIPIDCGSILVTSSSRLWGLDLNFIFNSCCTESWRLDFLAGFRYLQLDEGLGISMEDQPLPGIPAVGGPHVAAFDQFSADNRFCGGQIGLAGEWHRGLLFANAFGKCAIGSTSQIVGIQGATRITAPGMVQQYFTVGNLAAATNVGRYHRQHFAIAPEVGFNLGVKLTQCIRAYVGYSFFQWSNVVRVGETIDRVVNLTQVPGIGPGVLVGPARPAYAFNDTEFWANGVNAGIEFRW